MRSRLRGDEAPRPEPGSNAAAVRRAGDIAAGPLNGQEEGRSAADGGLKPRTVGMGQSREHLSGRTTLRVSVYEYEATGVVRRAVRHAVTLAPVAWLSARLLPAVDRLGLRFTRGRFTFSAWLTGLPVVTLTTTGARSGVSRNHRVMGIPDGDGLVVVAANFGQPANPAWYYNVRAFPDVVATLAGVERRYTARELTGEERDGAFARALALNPGWSRFQDHASIRTIPVVRLEPADRVEHHQEVTSS